MNISKMKNFLVVADHSSLTKAAELLYISQPVLSRQIVGIEKELDHQLFYRNRNGVQLTPAGMLVAESFRRILDEYAHLSAELSTENDRANGFVRIAASTGIQCPERYYRFVTDFEQTHPLVNVVNCQFEPRELLPALENGLADCAFLTESAIDTPDLLNLDYLRIGKVDIFLAVPKALMPNQSGPAEAAMFRGADWLVLNPARSDKITSYIYELCEKAGFEPRLRPAPNVSTLYMWLSTGRGVTLLSECSNLYQQDSLAFTNVGKEESLVIAWQKINDNTALKQLIHSYVSRSYPHLSASPFEKLSEYI